MERIARSRALGWDEMRLTAAAAAILAVAVASVRVLGVDRALRATRRPVSGAPLTGAAVRAYVRAVDRAGRYVPRGSCLPQSLALAWMLRRRGIDALVHIGVRTVGGFAAHAWVEAEGHPLTDGETFQPIVVN